MNKSALIVTLLSLLSIFILSGYFVLLRADDSSCVCTKSSSNKNPLFISIIKEGSENNIGTWRERSNVYDIFFSDDINNISLEPEQYLGDATKVILSKDFDQSQKLYAIIMMQHLSIKEYMCFMDAVNEAFEKNMIDKSVARFAISPDINIYGSSVYYWWFPDWRKRFMKNANSLFDQSFIGDVLSGRYFLYALNKE